MSRVFQDPLKQNICKVGIIIAILDFILFFCALLESDRISFSYAYQYQASLWFSLPELVVIHI